MDPEELERQREVVLQCLYDHEVSGKSNLLSGDDIAERTGISVADVDYHVCALYRDGAVRIERLQGGPHEVIAWITSLGEQLVREGVKLYTGRPTIQNIVGSIRGENIQFVGAAFNSDVSQVVNDPAMLRQALDSLGKQLIDAVTGELSEIDLSIYVDAVEELRAELSGPRDAGKVKKLMRTLALAGDIEGSLGLAARVSPYVAAGWALVQQLGIT